MNQIDDVIERMRRTVGFDDGDIDAIYELEDQRDTLRSLLEEARNGLEWYRTEYPEADGREDDEVFERIDAALNSLP